MIRYCIVLLCFGLLSDAMNQITISTQADLHKAYEKIAMSYWQSTTIAYLEKHPDASESLILKRYIKTFVSRAMRNGLPQSANIIGAEIHTNRTIAPSTQEEYRYIIKGKQSGCIAAVLVYTYKWDEKLKEIEEIIKKKMQG